MSIDGYEYIFYFLKEYTFRIQFTFNTFKHNMGTRAKHKLTVKEIKVYVQNSLYTKRIYC